MPASAASTARERVFTPALLICVLAVAGILVFAGFERWSTGTLEQCVRDLADGDLDAPARQRVLRFVVSAAENSSDPNARWAGLMAAVALADREAYRRARARIEGVPAERRFLDLGDPMLRNLGAAMWAEAAGESDEARRRWRQVQAQCRLVPRPLAAELAAEALK